MPPRRLAHVSSSSALFLTPSSPVHRLHRRHHQSLIKLSLAIFFILLSLVVDNKSHFALALKCYDGSAFHLGDAFVTDPQLRPSKGLRFTNWNYILIKDNCTACSIVVFTQEPDPGDNTPTVLFHLVCERPKSEHIGRSCSLNEKKFKADIKAMDNVDLSNLQLSDKKLPEWEDRNELKSRVSSRLLTDLNATPIKVLPNAKRTCKSCSTDLCNYFDMNLNISCSIRFGIQSFYTIAGVPLCSAQAGCLLHTNITWKEERKDRAVCLPKGCTRSSLSQCEKNCGDALTNKKCSCWCNGDYSVKSYNFPAAVPPAAPATSSAAATAHSHYVRWPSLLLPFLLSSSLSSLTTCLIANNYCLLFLIVIFKCR